MESSRVERTCQFCGKPLTIKPSAAKRGRGKFCSNSHKGKYQMATNPPDQKGEKNSNYKGGRYKKDGYIMVLNHEHPNNNYGYVPEHRLAMEEYMGRYLTADEVVHHINGVKDDNRIENLKVMSREEHNRIHHSKNFN